MPKKTPVKAESDSFSYLTGVLLALTAVCHNRYVIRRLHPQVPTQTMTYLEGNPYQAVPISLFSQSCIQYN